MKYAVVFYIVTIGLVQARLRITNQWNDGFQGAIDIFIPNQITNGWTLEIHFDRSVVLDVRMKEKNSVFLLLFIVVLGMARRSSIEN